MTHPHDEVIDDRDGDQEMEYGMKDEEPSQQCAPDEESEELHAKSTASASISGDRSGKEPSDPTDNGESSSTGGSTSEGKSDSGGGYSGDCSASEQSSDDTGGQKNPLERGGRRLSSSAGAAREDEIGSGDYEDDSVDKLEADKNTPPSAQPEMDDARDAENMVRLGRSRKSTKRRDRGSASSPHAPSILPARSSEQGVSSSRRSSLKQGAGGHDDDDESDGEIAELKERIGQVALEMLDGSRILPQWNGIRIKHPMDPRIDLSTVGWSAQAPLAHAPASQHGGDAVHSDPGQDATANEEAAATLESYQRIMEVVRPWFMLHGKPYSGDKPREDSVDAQGSGSSEGFTSFFTTTHSGSSSGGGAGSNSSDQDKKPPAQPDALHREYRAQHDQQQEGSRQHEPDLGDGEASDTSSMVVLARAKRKHSRLQEEGNSNASNSSRERRVRIHDAPEQDPAREARQHRVPMHANDIEGAPDINNNVVGEPQESSVTSSSSDQHDNAIHGPGQFGGPPHFVTEGSSSNRTDSTGSNLPSSSGSGSAGNTASGTGSGTGSGSNQGSSGSGNDNDGKGSSDDVAKEDNSADGTNNEGSDGAENPNKRVGLGLIGHRHDAADHSKPDGNEALDNEGTARERKLIDKKRKRIEMRREYEAQQQSESSENNEKKGDLLHRPGKAITMDQVLQFSKIPRVVVQAITPFAVVHTNAAYSRLTGVDSHRVVGKPIRTLVSLPDGINVSGSQDELSETAETPNQQAATSVATTSRVRSSKSSRKASTLERLVVSSGYGQVHSVDVHTRPHHMLGKNVSFLQDVAPRVGNTSVDHEKRSSRRADFGSPDTSLTGSLEGHPVIRCRMSIAPVVSSTTELETMVVSDKDSIANQLKAKRRKLHANEADAHRSRTHPVKEAAAHRMKQTSNQIVTHFVIQLQQELASAKQESEASLSSNSTSVEARLLGLSKSEFLGHRKALEGSKLSLANQEALLADDAADSQSHSTGTKEQISTVG